MFGEGKGSGYIDVIIVFFSLYLIIDCEKIIIIQFCYILTKCNILYWRFITFIYYVMAQSIYQYVDNSEIYNFNKKQDSCL